MKNFPPEMLIATHNAVALVRPNKTLVLHSGSGIYYGITWSEDRIWVVARANEPSRMLEFTTNFFPVTPPGFVHKGPPGDGPHQIFYEPVSGVLHVTNSQFNRVERWCVLTDQVLEPVYFEEPQGCDDVDHVNSITSHNGLWYVLEHRLSELPKRIRICTPDWKLIRTIAIPNKCLAEGSMHRGVHNVDILPDGSYLTLGPSQMIIDGEEIEWPEVVPYRHYLRGYARDDNYLYIGMSWANAREVRGWGHSRILVVENRPPYELVRSIILPKEFGQIMEIRLLNDDLAHNSLKCPLEV